MADKKLTRKEFEKAKEALEDASVPLTEIVKQKKEPTDLEQIEAELREISPTLKDLKNTNPAKYKEVYRHFMWVVGERDRIKAEQST